MISPGFSSPVAMAHAGVRFEEDALPRVGSVSSPEMPVLARYENCKIIGLQLLLPDIELHFVLGGLVVLMYLSGPTNLKKISKFFFPFFDLFICNPSR